MKQSLVNTTCLCQVFSRISFLIKSHGSLLVLIGIKAILSVNEEGHNCLDISNISSHLKVNKLLDQEFFIVGSFV